MNALLIAALSLLALPACILREPAADARTPAQIVARVLAARWWESPVWLLHVTLGTGAVAAWWAARSALFNTSAVAAWLLAKVASAASNDGRRYRLARSDGLRALPS